MLRVNASRWYTIYHSSLTHNLCEWAPWTPTPSPSIFDQVQIVHCVRMVWLSVWWRFRHRKHAFDWSVKVLLLSFSTDSIFESTKTFHWSDVVVLPKFLVCIEPGFCIVCVITLFLRFHPWLCTNSWTLKSSRLCWHRNLHVFVDSGSPFLLFPPSPSLTSFSSSNFLFDETTASFMMILWEIQQHTCILMKC